MEKIKTFIKSARFSELVRYGVIGVCTTAINYAVYCAMTGPLNRLLFGTAEPGTAWMNAAVAVSWLLSVLFAFFTNKLWVFRSRDTSGKRLTGEIVSFAAARILSYIFDEVFMNVAVPLGMHHLAAKLVSNIFVILMNYFTGRLIFRHKADR